MEELHPEIRRYMNSNTYDLVDENPQIDAEQIF